MFRSRLPLFASLISATFLVSLLTANAATVTGTTCSKLNSTKIVSNIKYTCIKSGKKLVWNKGSKILVSNKPTVSPQPIPTITPTIIATVPTPSPSETVKKLSPAEELVLQINTKLNSQLPTVDLNSVSANRIGNYFIDPILPIQFENSAKLTLQKVAASWDILRISAPPSIYVSDSVDWLISNSQAKRANCLNTSQLASSTDWLNSNKSRPYTWAIVYCLTSTPIVIVPVDPESQDVNNRENKILTAVGSDLGYSAIGLTDQTRNLPIWFVRGLKQVVSEYMESVGSSKWAITNWRQPSCSNKTLSDFNYSYENTSDWCSTLIGLFASRLIVADYGFKETLAFSIESNRTGTVDFDKFLGMPLKQYEARISEYLNASGVFSNL